MIGLRSILINGEAYPVFYGMYGLALIMEKNNLDLGGVFVKIQSLISKAGEGKIGGSDLIFMYDFIHAGFATGSMMENKTFPYNAIQLSGLIHFDGPELEDIFLCFSETMPHIKEEQKKIPNQPKKRKVRPKK